MADLARGVTILATRKTAPGLRHFDKKAVVAGGGGTHRMRLDDMVLIKDNHLALAGRAEECVRLAKKNVGFSIRVECEVGNLKEALAAISAGADVVMLDNFTPKQAADAIRQITKMGLRKKVKIEISGGINAKNIRQYARAGPDFVSLGYITHSPNAVDFSLEITK
jgi:nicotinate-nucleotide pyrophosphorylase (carboxylating)